MALGFFIQSAAHAIAGFIQDGIQQRKDSEKHVEQLVREAATFPPEEIRAQDGSILGYVRHNEFLDRWAPETGFFPWGAWPLYYSRRGTIEPYWAQIFSTREDAVRELVRLRQIGAKIPIAPWVR